MPDEPTTPEELAEQLAAVRARVFETQVEIARTEFTIQLEEEKKRALLAEIRANHAERRIEELEAALGRRRRAAHDRSRGVERFRDK